MLLKILEFAGPFNDQGFQSLSEDLFNLGIQLRHPDMQI